MEPTFEPLEVLDWYDGIVLGVVRIGEGGGPFLAALLCWGQTRRLRVYALLGIDRAEGARLKSLDWPRLTAEVEHSFAKAYRDIPIICVDERNHTVVAEKHVPSSDVLVDVVSDIEQALGPERTRWLDALVPSNDPDDQATP
jgi:hypothetical protein